MKPSIRGAIEDQLNGLGEAKKEILLDIWRDREEFIRWPRSPLLLWPGATKIKSGFHDYPDSVLEIIKGAGITVDARSNGPAVMEYLLAKGERPERVDGKGWDIHHIYDGEFPLDDLYVPLHA